MSLRARQSEGRYSQLIACSKKATRPCAMIRDRLYVSCSNTSEVSKVARSYLLAIRCQPRVTNVQQAGAAQDPTNRNHPVINENRKRRRSFMTDCHPRQRSQQTLVHIGFENTGQGFHVVRSISHSCLPNSKRSTMGKQSVNCHSRHESSTHPSHKKGTIEPTIGKRGTRKGAREAASRRSSTCLAVTCLVPMLR